MTSDELLDPPSARHLSLVTIPKQAANYCDYFQPNPVLLAEGGRSPSKAGDAKKKFASLFKS